MIVLPVVDMQAALFTETTPRFDTEGVVLRINKLNRAVRKGAGTVIFIQHEEPKGDLLEAADHHRRTRRHGAGLRQKWTILKY